MSTYSHSSPDEIIKAAAKHIQNKHFSAEGIDSLKDAVKLGMNAKIIGELYYRYKSRTRGFQLADFGENFSDDELLQINSALKDKQVDAKLEVADKDALLRTLFRYAKALGMLQGQ